MAGIDEKERLQIGSISSRTGVNIETIRYYERIGIMPEPTRSERGTRLYNHDQLRRLAFIKRSRELGFSLDDIRGLLELVDGGSFSCAEVHAVTTAHLGEVKQKIADLRKMEKVLKVMADECSQGDLPDCPIIDSLYSDPMN